MKTLQINVIKQVGKNNCWAACLSMALVFFKVKNASEKELVKKYDLGLSLDEVNAEFAAMFKKNGIKSDYRSELSGEEPKISFSMIKSSIDANELILIGLYNYNGHNAHTLLIYGYDQETNEVACVDPWTGKSILILNTDLQSMEWSETLIIGTN